LTNEEPEAVTTLDLSLGEEECARVMREAAMRGTGFFFLEGHGIPQDVLDGAFESHATFFGKSKSFKNRFRVKTKAENPGGYKDAQVDMITVDKESQRSPDFRELLRVSRERYASDFHSENGTGERKFGEGEGDQLKWFDETTEGEREADPSVARFKRNLETYFGEANALSRRVRRVLALSLGLPASDLERHYTRPLDLLLMNHYPATKRSPAKGDFGLGAHCDYGFTTLLLTDGTPGLQVCKDKTKSVGEREWVSVPAQKKGTFVINFGDLVEILSNGKYASVLHRVVNTSGQERKSIAFFCEPSADARISPILAAGEKAKYGVVENYADYQASKFASISENIDGTD